MIFAKGSISVVWQGSDYASGSDIFLKKNHEHILGGITSMVFIRKLNFYKFRSGLYCLFFKLWLVEDILNEFWPKLKICYVLVLQ